MATVKVRTEEKDSLARFLGWFSLGLGTAQLAAPGTTCRIVGASGQGLSRQVMRALGARELLQGLGILMRPRPTAWLWSRVAGDILDLSLLGLVAARNRRARTAVAAANVVAVAVPDVLESRLLSARPGRPRRGLPVRKTVTINRSREKVERAWVGAQELRERVLRGGGEVSVADAPGRRGTELAVEFVQDSAAGDLGLTVRRLAGRDLATRLADDLRRFKQLVETGEVARSDSTPQGHRVAGHLRQRPAQPLEAAR